MFFTKPTWDALIVVLIVLLFFGPKRLPALARSLGDSMREFKSSIGGKSDESEERPELQAAVANPAPERERAAQATPTERPGTEAGSQSS